MRGWLDRWSAINGSPSHLLPPLSELPPATEEMPDRSITAYSFDRLVVCQTDEVAQMLIANNFHFENNCAILSISGYPQRIFDTTMQMLRRNPELRVFAFHDCSPEGIELASRLRSDPRWFPDESIPIIDVGLSIRQILASKRDVFMRASKASIEASLALNPRVRQNLSKEELEWLGAGNFVELESFTPRTLIRVLQRSIANSRALESIEENNLILLGDSGSMYSIDSFG
ncbi:hypothetical protein V0288_16295 [Pannus brasiliensis CCIBt3594]|uniref:Topoisomerase 6 subunit A/Spo11 TOPRIM domain-containing protein n=1 Tax=Pannus brasiliensis CCIBt3594 TaxID=1427578 RepID=A0AAW9QLM2_9CHRO